jgi:hypothetical protein
LEDLGVDGRMLLKWIFKKWDVGHGLDRSDSGQGQVAGSCERGNEHSGFIKCGNFLSSRGPVCFSGRTLLHGIRL